jgi:hypothetical protein
MKDVSNFKNFRKGDIATLSDIQTQKEFGELTADFKIIEIRTYREPGGFFHYTGYVCEYQGKGEEDESQQIMILLREMGEMYDLFVYYMDQEGDVTEYPFLIEEKAVEDEKDSGEKPVEDEVSDFDDNDDEDEEEDEDSGTTEDLVERFEVTLNFDEGESDVTWDKKEAGSTFGVETTSTETESDTKTLAEYFTNDETHGNPYCFIEWTGDSKKGWIEIWYGCEIQPEDLEMFRTKK